MNARIKELSSQIRTCLNNLNEIAGELDQSLTFDIAKLGRTRRSALIVAGLLENYYTCLETTLFRISQHFENTLSSDKWHRELLSKMAIDIDGVRIAVISRDNYNNLVELMRFRHFKRYYYQIDYDWCKLDFLVGVARRTHPLILGDLGRFDAFLHSLLDSPRQG